MLLHILPEQPVNPDTVGKVHVYLLTSRIVPPPNTFRTFVVTEVDVFHDEWVSRVCISSPLICVDDALTTAAVRWNASSGGARGLEGSCYMTEIRKTLFISVSRPSGTIVARLPLLQAACGVHLR